MRGHVNTQTSQSRPSRLSPVTLLGQLLLAACALLATACEDKAEKMLAETLPVLDELLPLIERDTKQVRDGLPKGAALLAQNLDDDPGADPEGLRRVIKKARAGVNELQFAKSTFFIFVDTEGTVLRGESDPDLPAGKSLTQEVPEAKQMVAADAGRVELFGSMHGLRGAEKGADRQWLVGHPVKDKEGKKVKGAFVTGWSLRKYAEYLENHARNSKLLSGEKKKPALCYIFVVHADQAFGGPVTPDVNTEAVSKLGIVEKAKSGSFKTLIEVEQRRFALGAKPVKALGDKVAIAIMLSEF